MKDIDNDNTDNMKNSIDFLKDVESKSSKEHITSTSNAERILYIDCFSGISGDMMVGALLDLEDKNFTLQILQEELKKIALNGYKIEVSKVKIGSIKSTRFNVLVETSQPPRNYNIVKNLITCSSLKKEVKDLSSKIFFEIAKAESKIHDCPIESIHFHEVGAVDSIIDIVSTAIAVVNLKIKSVYCRSVPLGTGFVKTMHGLIPVPAPATVEILKGLPVYGGNFNFEVTTPTGAAIIKVLAKKFGNIPELKIEAIGYGAPQGLTKTQIKESNFDHLEIHQEKNLVKTYKKNKGLTLPILPNILRLFLGNAQNESIEAYDKLWDVEDVIILSTNIDDSSPEVLGYLFEKLLSLNTLDVWIEPILMKKNRQSFKLCVICQYNSLNEILKVIFEETNTLGIRFQQIKRAILKRESKIISLPYGNVKVKIGYLGNKVITISPEYESCRILAQKTNKPIKTIYNDLMFFFSKK